MPLKNDHVRIDLENVEISNVKRNLVTTPPKTGFMMLHEELEWYSFIGHVRQNIFS